MKENFQSDIFSQEEEKLIKKIISGLEIQKPQKEHEKEIIAKIIQAGSWYSYRKKDEIMKHGKFFYRILLAELGLSKILENKKNLLEMYVYDLPSFIYLCEQNSEQIWQFIQDLISSEAKQTFKCIKLFEIAYFLLHSDKSILE